MARIVYFILAVDLDNETVSIDDHSFTMRYSEQEQVWDTEAEMWRKYQELDDNDTTEYSKALELLNTKKLEND